jgi:glycosyltransferase involved in cell wall biosynthesis
MLHHDPDGGYGGATHMAWRTAEGLAARGHAVALAGTPPASDHARFTLPGWVAAASGHLAPGAALAAAAGDGFPGRGSGRGVRWLGPELPGSLGEVAVGAGWVPEVVHVTDLVDPLAATAGLALARGAGALLALTPATDATLWREPGPVHRVAGQADVVFTLTPAEDRSVAAAGVPTGRLARLGQGPQLAGVPDPAGFRAAVGASGPLVLFLGRKLPTKGYQHLVAAAPAIVERHPSATIVVAGPEPARPGCGAAPVRHDRLRQLGVLDETEKHSALVAADVLVLPSIADAFPLVFVEAWWCATPVVSGPFPGAREVVRHGVDGLVVDADPAAVATAVTALLDDPARAAAMGRAGRDRARSDLSWAAVAATVERGYRDAAAATAGARTPTDAVDGTEAETEAETETTTTPT